MAQAKKSTTPTGRKLRETRIAAFRKYTDTLAQELAERLESLYREEKAADPSLPEVAEAPADEGDYAQEVADWLEEGTVRGTKYTPYDFVLSTVLARQRVASATGPFHMPTVTRQVYRALTDTDCRATAMGGGDLPVRDSDFPV